MHRKYICCLFLLFSILGFPSRITAANNLFNPKNIINSMSGKKQLFNQDIEDQSVNVVILKYVTPQQSDFYGEVEAIKSVDLSFDFKGKLSYVIEDGAYALSEIKDKSGNIIRPATILASYDASILKNDLMDSTFEFKQAEIDYNYYAQDLEITQQLAKKNAIAKKEYYQALRNLNNAYLELKRKEFQNKTSQKRYLYKDLKAPFTGLVIATYVTSGQFTSDFKKILKLTKIDVVIVNLPLLPALSSILQKNTNIIVYPNAAYSQTLKGWIEKKSTNGDSIDIYVNNRISEGNDVSKFSGLRSVYKVFHVTEMYETEYNAKQDNKTNQESDLESFQIHIISDTDSKPVVDSQRKTDLTILDKNAIGVPTQSIRKDPSGKYFVFVVDLPFATNKDVSINPDQVFKVKRVDIVPGSVVKDYILSSNYNIELTSLKDTGGLKLGDIIISECSAEMQSGDKAVFVEKKWLLFPGDKVKIRIPSLGCPGFYVPPQSIMSADQKENYVYLVKNNSTIKLEKVTIKGYAKGYYAIASPNLKEDDLVVILGDPVVYERFYDNAAIDIGQVINPSEFLVQQSIMRKYDLKSDAQDIENIKFKSDENYDAATQIKDPSSKERADVSK